MAKLLSTIYRIDQGGSGFPDNPQFNSQQGSFWYALKLINPDWEKRNHYQFFFHNGYTFFVISNREDLFLEFCSKYNIKVSKCRIHVS